MNEPFVSLVLPIRDEEMHIEACLNNLLKQDYPRERIEILVIDGMSTDRTCEIVAKVAAANPDISIRLLENPAKIVPPALNIGLKAATGEILIRMDGHAIPAEDYITACVRALRDSGADNVGGVIHPVSSGPFGEAVAVAQSHPVGAGDSKFHYASEAQFVDTVPWGAFRRSILERSGLFDESMVRNQDYELNVRIRKAGGRIYLAPSIRADYVSRNSPSRLWRQYFDYGWWRVQTLRRHPDSLRWRQGLPPLFVASLLLLPFFSFMPLFAGLFVLQATAYLSLLGGGAWTARHRLPAGRGNIFRLVAAFAIMHIAYGLGFILSTLSGGRFPYRAGSAVVPTLLPHSDKSGTHA